MRPSRVCWSGLRASGRPLVEKDRDGEFSGRVWKRIAGELVAARTKTLTGLPMRATGRC
jgi:hypothetical protein